MMIAHGASFRQFFTRLSARGMLNNARMHEYLMATILFDTPHGYGVLNESSLKWI